MMLLLATAPAWADAIVPAEREQAWLGVAWEPGAHGIRIKAVIDDSPADLCGLAAGDEILAVEGKRVTPGQELRHLIDDFRPGDAVRFSLLREDRRLETRTVLGEVLAPNDILARTIVGRPAPAFELEPVQGLTSGTLSDHAGRVVVLDFFATHCQPCREAHEALARAAEDRQGMVILAISEEQPDALAMYAQGARAELTVLHDPLARVRESYSPYYSARPTLVVVDPAGVVRYAGIAGDGGVVTSAAALANVDQALFAVDRALRQR